ncbi:hypothetical protein J4731_10050 [Providencia rettgeri]|nr:hypothetical protein [Providencia rettgeri]
MALFLLIEHIKRFTADDAQHIAPFWYYIPIIILGAIPWAGLLPGAIMKGWKERKSSPDMFSYCAGLLFLLSFSVFPAVSYQRMLRLWRHWHCLWRSMGLIAFVMVK